MSKIKLTGDTSGYVEISAPNAAGNNTLELPATGSKIVVADSSDNLNVAGILTSVGGLNVGTGGTVITTTASGLVGLNSTSPAATIDIRTAPQWSSSNYGADLIIGGSRNNSLGLLDSNNAQPWAIANTGGTLTVATMPNLGDTSTAPTNRMQIDTGGHVTMPHQPSANWEISVNTGTGVRSYSLKRGADVTAENAGNGSSHGTVGRFTAPATGTYLITTRLRGTAPSGSNELYTIYGSWSTSVNALTPGMEVLDLRVGTNVNDGTGWGATIYLSTNDYLSLDWYRPTPTTYLGDSVVDISVHLLG